MIRSRWSGKRYLEDEEIIDHVNGGRVLAKVGGYVQEASAVRVLAGGPIYY